MLFLFFCFGAQTRHPFTDIFVGYWLKQIAIYFRVIAFYAFYSRIRPVGNSLTEIAGIDVCFETLVAHLPPTPLPVPSLRLGLC